ncbi:hypothetical protein [Paraburkholderia phosphatilytica]|nr:hypothetical protein [Paraburkholderia phosphatilytica]
MSFLMMCRLTAGCMMRPARSCGDAAGKRIGHGRAIVWRAA